MKTSNLIIAGFAITILVYLAFAFALWEMNPGNWSQDYRVGFIAMWGAAIFIGGCVVGYINDIRKLNL